MKKLIVSLTLIIITLSITACDFSERVNNETSLNPNTALPSTFVSTVKPSLTPTFIPTQQQDNPEIISPTQSQKPTPSPASASETTTIAVSSPPPLKLHRLLLRRKLRQLHKSRYPKNNLLYSGDQQERNIIYFQIVDHLKESPQ